jgi:hypothetical protein
MNDLYQKLAEEANRVSVSPALEAKLLKEFRRQRVRQALPPALFAIAASLVLAVWLMPGPKPQRLVVDERPVAKAPVVQESKSAQAKAPATQLHRPRRVKEAPFQRIPYSADLAPNERAEVLRVDMPVSAFAAAGIQIATADTGATARADLIVGEDGMARAFRILSVSSNE